MTILRFLTDTAMTMGCREAAVRAATVRMLGIVEHCADAADFRAVLEEIPGCESLLLSSDLDDPAEVAGFPEPSLLAGPRGLQQVLRSSGLPGDQIGEFAAHFFSFLSRECGEARTRSILQRLPDLRGLFQPEGESGQES